MRDLHTVALDMMIDVSNAKSEDDQTVRVLRQLKAFREEILEEAALIAIDAQPDDCDSACARIRALKGTP
jgi:hypothetical protein